MKTITKLFMALHVWIYRMSGGKVWGRMRGFDVILLTTKGRKTGKSYTTPLGRFEHESGYVIVASNSGQPNNPAWYYNLKSNPQVTIQVLDQVMPATAEELAGDARTQAWRQVIATSPFYADYEKRAKREIPLILLRPGK
jgi:deazaflavin-dependent oxidoreductase (nitroreductase family)